MYFETKTSTYICLDNMCTLYIYMHLKKTYNVYFKIELYYVCI